MRKHRREKKIFKAHRLLSAKERRIRRAAEILGSSARLNRWKDRRLMIPKECPLARIPNSLILEQPLKREGSEDV